ncbi:hypothetical protein [Brevibacillus nitrificans]|uniref:hypothetical protein n=1 Tax=Brevibacillus nitrificans TaxID=651560 RepID=UPI00263637A6|nr:hypothetical protein [Brevibacillus nitrificans]
MKLLRHAVMDKLQKQFGVQQVGGKPLNDVSTTEMHDLLGRLEMEQRSGRSA